MAKQSQILLFGDLTSDFDSTLTQLAAKKGNVLLESFFEQVAFDLRAEIGAVSFNERERLGIGRFTTLMEILATLRKSSSPHPALEKALTCASQFARFIRYGKS
jgi:Starter unit:ACP transacylase in aflatoxin biosynthesis